MRVVYEAAMQFTSVHDENDGTSEIVMRYDAWNANDDEN